VGALEDTGGGVMRKVYVPARLGGQEGKERVSRRDVVVAWTSWEAFS
jgi:hypothetical protein